MKRVAGKWHELRILHLLGKLPPELFPIPNKPNKRPQPQQDIRTAIALQKSPTTRLATHILIQLHQQPSPLSIEIHFKPLTKPLWRKETAICSCPLIQPTRHKDTPLSRRPLMQLDTRSTRRMDAQIRMDKLINRLVGRRSRRVGTTWCRIEMRGVCSLGGD